MLGRRHRIGGDCLELSHKETLVGSASGIRLPSNLLAILIANLQEPSVLQSGLNWI